MAELAELAGQGACSGLPTDMFFVELSDTTDRRYRTLVQAARAVCRACPVMIQCAEYAIEEPEAYGVWGGTTPRERQLLRSRRRVPA